MVKKNTMRQTEIGLIPMDWKILKLGEIAEVIGGGTPSTFIPKYWNGDIDWFTPTEVGYSKYLYSSKRKISDLGFKNASANLLPENSILLTTRAGIGDLGILKIKACTNQGFQSIVCKENIDYEYIYYLMSTKKEELLKNASGSTFLEISPNKIKNIKIPLPPLSEQKIIAQAISDCDTWIESLEQIITKKRLIKQGAMQELLTPKEGWKLKKLVEVAQYRRGSFPQPYGLDKWYDDINGMPFIQVFDVAKNRRLKVDTKRKISEAAQLMSVFVPKGTIVLTIQGSIGRIALTQYDAYCDRTLLIFERINSDINKFFFLLSVEQIFEIEKEKAPGGTIKTITKEALSNFVFAYPKSFTEQTRIATILSDMDVEIEVLTHKLNKARQLKQGMIQELLTGKTRLV